MVSDVEFFFLLLNLFCFFFPLSLSQFNTQVIYTNKLLLKLEIYILIQFMWWNTSQICISECGFFIENWVYQFGIVYCNIFIQGSQDCLKWIQNMHIICDWRRITSISMRERRRRVVKTTSIRLKICLSFRYENKFEWM